MVVVRRKRGMVRYFGGCWVFLKISKGYLAWRTAGGKQSDGKTVRAG